MGASGTDKLPLRRDELDTLLDRFEQDLTMRVDALVDYCNGYADSILSVTGVEDDPHVSGRIDAILRQCGLASELADLSESRES
jgi:hypothetical protein